MKALLINGSHRKEGNTFIALSEVAAALENDGIATKIIGIGVKPVQGCIACNKCGELNRCVFHDELYDTVRNELKDADALIIGTPVYYAGANGSLCALLDRLFYSCPELLQYKPAAAVAVCRRGGATSAFDRLNKYFTISNMPVVPSQYWNILYGRLPGEVRQDAEGLQTMTTALGANLPALEKRGMNEKFVSSLGEALINTTRLNSEQERLKGELKATTSALVAAKEHLHTLMTEAIKVVKLQIPKEHWIEFGITDKR